MRMKPKIFWSLSLRCVFLRRAYLMFKIPRSIVSSSLENYINLFPVNIKYFCLKLAYSFFCIGDASCATSIFSMSWLILFRDNGFWCRADCFFGLIRKPFISTLPYSSSVFLFFRLCFSKIKGQFLISSYFSKMFEKMYSAFCGEGWPFLEISDRLLTASDESSFFDLSSFSGVWGCDLTADASIIFYQPVKYFLLILIKL